MSSSLNISKQIIENMKNPLQKDIGIILLREFDDDTLIPEGKINYLILTLYELST